MPLRSYKPTSPGRRFMTRSTFEEITTDEPHKPLLESQKRGSGRNNQGRLTVRHRGGGEKRALPPHRLQARQVGRAGAARHHRVRPQPLGAHRAAPLPRRREALHPGAQRPQGRRHGPGRRRPPRRASGNALPLSGIPLGTQIHNIELVPGKGGQIVRSAGRLGAAAGQGGRLGPGPPAVGRGAPRRHALHGHGRPGRQPRPREPEPRQGRPCPPHGQAARSPRRRR